MAPLFGRTSGVFAAVEVGAFFAGLAVSELYAPGDLWTGLLLAAAIVGFFACAMAPVQIPDDDDRVVMLVTGSATVASVAAIAAYAWLDLSWSLLVGLGAAILASAAFAAVRRSWIRDHFKLEPAAVVFLTLPFGVGFLASYAFMQRTHTASVA